MSNNGNVEVHNSNRGITTESRGSSVHAGDYTEKSEFYSREALPEAILPADLPAALYKSSTGSSEPGTAVASAAASLKDDLGTIEKGEPKLAWEGYLDDELPDKIHGHYLRNLRFQAFSMYRKIFSIVFITNMAIFIALCIRGGNNVTSKHLGKIVVANIFVAIMMRQDQIINGFYHTFTSVPRSWPLWIRRICARVYGLGGIHSGSGVSGVIWLILFTVQATREAVRKDGVGASPATVAITYIILVDLLILLAMAYPALRHKFHNNFEGTHRFLGWTAAGLVWAQVILLTKDWKDPNVPLHKALVQNASFWLVVVFTGGLASSWMHLKKVPCVPEVLSQHAIRIHFGYSQADSGSFVRLSESPLFEWHSFASVAEPNKHGFSVIVSRAGDWASKMIENPPREMWIRSVPVYGVMSIVPMFRRAIVVATGSGIAPCTPVVLQQRIPIRLLWTAPSIRETFGNNLVDALLGAEPGTVVYDTRKYGKPDMVKLVYRMYKEFDAEAVMIISNTKLTQKVVYGLMSRGIPCFGAIWDS